MLLSDDRQTYFIHLIINALEKKGLVSFLSKEQAITCTRAAISQCMKELAQVDRDVRSKISSLKRNVQDQSSEWEVLYSSYTEEELVRRGINKTKEKPVRR